MVAALVFVCSVVGAGLYGYHERGKRADAEIAALKSEADKAVAQAREQAAKVSEKVVIQYRDRVVKIRETPPEVAHEVQIIRDSDCRLPREWVRLHDAAASGEDPAPGGIDETPANVDCAGAIEVVRENYLRSRENAEQLKALQAWAEGVAR